MKPAALLELAGQVGVALRIGSAGRIKAKGEAERINRLAPLIREHKAELLAFLQSGSDRPSFDERNPPPPTDRDIPTERGTEHTRSNQRAEQYKPVGSRPPATRLPDKMTPRAVAWLAEHRPALKAAGWTAGELYRRDRSRGMGWLRLWNKEDLKAVFDPSGRIVFTFINGTGQRITQTAVPQSKLWKRSGGQ